MKQVHKSFAIALCGVLAALGVVCMLLASVFPVLGIIMPGVAGLLVLLACVECNLKMAVMLYCSISLLGLMLVPDKEVVFLFIILLGYYPLLKAKIEHVPCKLLVVLLKFLLLNIAITINIMVFYVLFSVASLSELLMEIGLLFVIILYAMCVFAFFTYDKALLNLLLLYRRKWRKQLVRQYHKKRS